MTMIVYLFICFIILFLLGPFFCRYVCPYKTTRELLHNLRQLVQHRQICALQCKNSLCRRRKKAQAALGLICIFSFSLFYAPQMSIGLTALSENTIASNRLIPIYSVDTQGEKDCALTFDAAWGATRTISILDILDQYEIKATFFLTNIWMKEYPDMVKEIANRGHELGLHSESHPNLTQINAAQLEQEIEHNRQMVREITNIEAKAFRAPFGAYDNRLVQTLTDKGLIPVQWSADSLDWKELSAPDMLTILKKEISPGGILLFHNDGLHTPEVLPDLISYLKSQGYKCKTITDLIHPWPWIVDNQGVQHKEIINLSKNDV